VSEDEEESIRLPLRLIESNLDGFPTDYPNKIAGDTKEEEKQPLFYHKLAHKPRSGLQKPNGFLKIDVTAANQADPNVIIPANIMVASPEKIRIQAQGPPTTNEGLMKEIGVDL